MNEDIKEYVLGIDLGTTNSAMAIIKDGKVEVIPNSEGGRTTPSVVAFLESGERLVGTSAKRQLSVNPANVIGSIKRRMGEDYKINIFNKEYSPQEISAMILSKLKIDAEAYLGRKISKAVITVPAYFTDAQRQATKDAGKIAGLDVLRIINEPTAAALAFGLDKAENQKIMVFDLGGGTLDISILEITDGVFEVIGTAGNNKLGGDDLDNELMKYVISVFEKQNNFSLPDEKVIKIRIKEACEKAKIELSSLQKTTINVPFIATKNNIPLHIDCDVTRTRFETMITPYLKEMASLIHNIFKDTKLLPENIDKILLVGGSTRMPEISTMLIKELNKEPSKGVNPDECVAIGAAIQGGVLQGDIKGIVLIDVTPLSLGLEVMGGLFARIIDKNTSIPTKKSQIFSTASNWQTGVTISVYQGEGEFVSRNKLLGNFDLVGIPPAPKGTPQIEVTFEIDANGIVHVSAIDKATKKEQHIEIKSVTNLTDEEIKNAINEAAKYADEDKIRKEIIQLKNFADSKIMAVEGLIRETEKQEENVRKLSKEDLDSLRDSINTLESKIRDINVKEEINEAIKEFDLKTEGIVSKAYQEYMQGHEHEHNHEHEHEDNSNENIKEEEINNN